MAWGKPATAVASENAAERHRTRQSLTTHLLASRGPGRVCVAGPAYVGSGLVVGVASRDLDDAPVGQRDRLEEAERTAVPRRDELHADVVAGVERIGPGLADTALRERGRRSERQHPVGHRPVR